VPLKNPGADHMNKILRNPLNLFLSRDNIVYTVIKIVTPTTSSAHQHHLHFKTISTSKTINKKIPV